jgi:hypothetical protein
VGGPPGTHRAQDRLGYRAAIGPIARPRAHTVAANGLELAVVRHGRRNMPAVKFTLDRTGGNPA